MRRIIYSLCDYSGTWSQPYEDAGYDVRRVDLKHGQDVRLLELPREQVHGVLCAPLCTMFAISGARWRAEEKLAGTYDGKMIEALSVADACVRFAVASGASWWCLENPIGTLRRYHGPPPYDVQPLRVRRLCRRPGRRSLHEANLPVGDVPEAGAATRSGPPGQQDAPAIRR